MRPLKNICEVAVIGGGLAGLSAARHAARLGRLVTLFEGSGLFGGLVATIDEVDGLPVPGNSPARILPSICWRMRARPPFGSSRRALRGSSWTSA